VFGLFPSSAILAEKDGVRVSHEMINKWKEFSGLTEVRNIEGFLNKFFSEKGFVA